MLSVEWLNSRPYYLNSTTTPFDYVWGGMWFLFNEDSADLYGSAPLNLGLRLSINLEVEIASPNAEPVFGRCEAWFLNRFRIDGAGNVQDPSASEATYRYSTDDGRIGIPFQLFNLNTLQAFTQLSPVSRRERDQIMRAVPQTAGHMDVQFEFVLQSDPVGPNLKALPVVALPNHFLIPEVRHPGRALFVDEPPRSWNDESFVSERFEIGLDWNSFDESSTVEWHSEVDLPIGPNRYNRSSTFPGEKVFL